MKFIYRTIRLFPVHGAFALLAFSMTLQLAGACSQNGTGSNSISGCNGNGSGIDAPNYVVSAEAQTSNCDSSSANTAAHGEDGYGSAQADASADDTEGSSTSFAIGVIENGGSWEGWSNGGGSAGCTSSGGGGGYSRTIVPEAPGLGFDAVGDASVLSASLETPVSGSLSALTAAGLQSGERLLMETDNVGTILRRSRYVNRTDLG